MRDLTGAAAAKTHTHSLAASNYENSYPLGCLEYIKELYESCSGPGRGVHAPVTLARTHLRDVVADLARLNAARVDAVRRVAARLARFLARRGASCSSGSEHRHGMNVGSSQKSPKRGSAWGIGRNCKFTESRHVAWIVPWCAYYCRPYKRLELREREGVKRTQTCTKS